MFFFGTYFTPSTSIIPSTGWVVVLPSACPPSAGLRAMTNITHSIAAAATTAPIFLYILFFSESVIFLYDICITSFWFVPLRRAACLPSSCPGLFCYLSMLSNRRSVPAVGHFFSHTMSAHRIMNSTTLIIIAVFLDMICPPCKLYPILFYCFCRLLPCLTGRFLWHYVFYLLLITGVSDGL